jgi:hypothetical protein
MFATRIGVGAAFVWARADQSKAAMPAIVASTTLSVR